LRSVSVAVKRLHTLLKVRGHNRRGRLFIVLCIETQWGKLIGGGEGFFKGEVGTDEEDGRCRRGLERCNDETLLLSDGGKGVDNLWRRLLRHIAIGGMLRKFEEGISPTVEVAFGNVLGMKGGGYRHGE